MATKKPMAKYKEIKPRQYKVVRELNGRYYPKILCTKTTGCLWWKKSKECWCLCTTNGNLCGSDFSVGIDWHLDEKEAIKKVNGWLEGPKDVFKTGDR